MGCPVLPQEHSKNVADYPAVMGRGNFVRWLNKNKENAAAAE
jgi:hypothetical protein